MKKIIVGVMGAGEHATEKDKQHAYEVGKLIAENSWILLSGGRNKGVMDEVNKGAKEANGLTIGIIPANNNFFTSKYVDIPIVTGMGSARNAINILSSDIVIAIGMGAGTASEISLALKSNKHVVLLNDDQESKQFFQKLGGELVHLVASPEEAIEQVANILK